MKPEVNPQPESSRKMLLQLFSKFFQDHLLSQSELLRDKSAYQKNYDTWQKFIKMVSQGDQANAEGCFNLQSLTQKIQEIFNNSSSEKSFASYLEEVSTIVNSTQKKEDNIKLANQNQLNQIERARSYNPKRQLSIPQKPNLIRGDSIVEEENIALQYNYKQGQSLRSPKKSYTSILNISKEKQIKQEINQFKKPNHSIFEIPSQIQSKYNAEKQYSSSFQINQQDSNTFKQSNTNQFNQNAYNSINVADKDHKNIIELIEFLNSRNTKNYNDNIFNLYQESDFKENKKAYIYKASSISQEKMNIMDQFLFALSLSHYQDLFLNTSIEKWQNLLQIVSEQKQLAFERERPESDPTYKMTLQQAEQMKKIFYEMFEKIYQNKEIPSQLFNQFIEKTQYDEQFVQSLYTSLKELIVSTCKLNENQNFRKDIFNNWFQKNPHTDQIGIDSQKLKLLSYSLKKRIAILKLTQIMNSQKEIQSSTSLEILQSFDLPKSSIENQIPTLNILWHNTHDSNHFYVIINEKQKLFYTNILSQKKDIKSINPLIQVREISLQKCTSEQYSNSRSSSPLPLSPFIQSIMSKHTNDSEQFIQSSTLSSMHLLSSSTKNSLNKSPIQIAETNHIEKQPSLSTFSKFSTSMEQGFSHQAQEKLKEKCQKLKLMMIDDSFSINSLLMQAANNWTPLKQQANQQNQILLSPSIPSYQQFQSCKGFEQIQLTPNLIYPLSKPQLPEFEPISLPLRQNSNKIQLLGNQKILQDESNRGREQSQPQIKLLNQQSIRSASQNHIIKQEDKPLISLVSSSNQQHQHFLSFKHNVQSQLPSESRLRIQSGHVGSTGKFSEDHNPSGITLLGNIQVMSSKNSIPQLNQNEGMNAQCIKNEEQKKEESPEKHLGHHQTQISQPQIQLLSKYRSNIQYNGLQSDENDKNVLMLLGLTNSISTNSTSASNTNSTNTTPCNYIQNNTKTRQASFFSRNQISTNYNNSPQLDKGIKIVKSVSTSQNTLQNSSVPSMNDYRFYKDFSNLNKISTPVSQKTQQINQRGILLQQNIVLS